MNRSRFFFIYFHLVIKDRSLGNFLHLFTISKINKLRKRKGNAYIEETQLFLSSSSHPDQFLLHFFPVPAHSFHKLLWKNPNSNSFLESKFDC
jgi:hypothetical protein